MAERDIIARIVVEGGQQAATQLDNVAKSEREIVAATKEANTALDAQGNQLKENTNATKANVSAQDSLKKQLRELKAQLAQLAIAGKQNTAEYKRLRQEAGQLDDAIKDVNAEIAQAGSDTRGLDQVIRVASTATAAFGLVEGAAALFGDENEELQKSLLKVNAAMTILTSLQQIQTEITRKDSIFTVAAAKAKALYASATAGATAATKSFTRAFIATGIGAIAIALVAVAANWEKVSKAIGLSTDEQDKNSDAVEIANKLREIQNNLFESELRLKKALGASDKELLRTQLNKAKADLKELENTAKIQTGAQKAAIALQARNNLARQNIFDQESLNAEIERLLKLEGNQIKVSDELQTQLNNQNALVKELNNSLNDNSKEQEAATKAAQKAAEEREKQRAEFRLWEEAYDNFLKRQKENLKAVSDAGSEGLFSTTGGISDLRKQIDFLNKELENIAPGDPNQASIIILLKEAQAQLKVLEEQLARAKGELNELPFQGSIIPAGEIKNTQQNIEEQKGLLQNFGFFRAKLIRQQIQDAKDAGKDTTDLERELQAANFQGLQDSANQALAFFTKIQNARLAILQNQLDKGLISEEEYNQKVAQINRQQAIADKAKALFDIALITAENVVKYFGTPLAIVAGLVGAAQAAIVLATPIPKFRYGGQVLDGGSISPEGMLSGRSHAGGGMLIEAEGGEFITRREMTKKYLPILKAINQDKLGDVLYPKIPIMRTFGSVATQSQRKADKRMEMLIEEVQFMSQYIRQGNKYARVTADNTANLKTNKKHHRV